MLAKANAAVNRVQSTPAEREVIDGCIKGRERKNTMEMSGVHKGKALVGRSSQRVCRGAPLA
jgi:hypothetical protein